MEPVTFRLGDPYTKLDLEPWDEYDEEIQSLESLVNEEYSTVIEAAQVLNPRTSHEVFRPGYHGEEPAVVREDHVEDIIEILEENSHNSRTKIGEKLFDLGYRWREPFIDLRTAVEEPYRNMSNENMPDTGLLASNPFTQGKKKREGDKYYHFATGYLLKEMKDWSIEIE